jgi:hypothetical protein
MSISHIRTIYGHKEVAAPSTENLNNVINAPGKTIVVKSILFDYYVRDTATQLYEPKSIATKTFARVLLTGNLGGNNFGIFDNAPDYDIMSNGEGAEIYANPDGKQSFYNGMEFANTVNFLISCVNADVAANKDFFTTLIVEIELK